MTNAAAKIYVRKNGKLGSSCDGTSDTGHFIATVEGKYLVWSIHNEDERICTDGSREEAEKAIADDWRSDAFNSVTPD